MSVHSLGTAVQTVLDTLQRHRVQALLMGGQACVAYGASEFTRDVDLAVFEDPANLRAVAAAMQELDAEVIAVPPFEASMLEAGHAVHFRCRVPSLSGLRVNVMSRMRGVEAFPRLWERRTVLRDGLTMLALADLVAAKKTQRDNDWPMLRRLLEADYFARSSSESETDAAFWLRECRTPALLRQLVTRFPHVARDHARPAVCAARAGADDAEITRELRREEDAERAADEAYWQPLKRQLETMRRHAKRDS